MLLQVLGVQEEVIVKSVSLIVTVKIMPKPKLFKAFSMVPIIPGVATFKAVGLIALRLPFTVTPVRRYPSTPAMVTLNVLLFVNHAFYFHGSSKILKFYSNVSTIFYLLFQLIHYAITIYFEIAVNFICVFFHLFNTLFHTVSDST